MNEFARSTQGDVRRRGDDAEALVAKIFADAGWEVRTAGAVDSDMLVQNETTSYAVEVKAAAEGRADRLVPLWAQACLVAMRAAGRSHQPLAVVTAPGVSRSVAEQVLRFAEEFAPGVAAGVVDFQGVRRFRG
ncbi:MAG: hypothetical protein ICV87_12740, partial [Gemmatimonadetes bacterium]|nr:hypothetical protein [Gemmatimonadota bacterium]